MIELIKVEVKNFRSFSDATFTPLAIGQGMTALNGPNGAGKSTVVHAIVWALYGVTPEGVPVRALRRQGSDGDEVRSTVTFKHDGQVITVFRALRGKNDTTVAGISVDGVEQTTVQSRLATSWIIKRLNGLDAEGFLTAFVVRQKELDSLVRTRPAERRRTIERLAGIERMSAALERARGEARIEQKLLEALPPAVNVDELTTVVAENQIALHEAEDRVKELVQEHSTALGLASKLQNTLNAARRAEEEIRNARHNYELAHQKFTGLKEAAEELAQEAIGADNLVAAQSAADAARENRLNAEQAVRDVEQSTRAAKEAAEAAGHAEVALSEAAERLQRLEEAIKTETQTLASFPIGIEEALTQATEKHSGLLAEKGALEGEIERLAKAIKTLEAMGIEHAECPTCQQKLEDRDHLIETLSLSRSSAEEKLMPLSEEISKTADEVRRLNKSLQDFNKSQSDLSSLQEQQKDAEEAHALSQERFAKALDTAETRAEEAHEATTIAEKAEAELSELRAQEQKAVEALRKAEKAAEAAEKLLRSEEIIGRAKEHLDELKSTWEEAASTAPEDDLESLERQAREAAFSVRTLNENLSSAQTRHALRQRDFADSQTQLEQAQKHQETRLKQLAKVEIATTTASALEEFRRDRLARLAPELSEVASDFVSKMTEGKYLSVELDEEFTPVLTDSSGAQRPVAWLSGGEESAVALALRVAIGEVLSGQGGGLLVLDEVLTAQDRQRRAATMAAIRALPRQIITINHVSEATDMVDLVFEVVDDGNGASTLQGVGLGEVPADLDPDSIEASE